MDSDAQRELTIALNARREGRVVPIKLSYRELSGLQAIAADLSSADLEGADLEGACLAGARLVRANLKGADLRDADLGGADLTEANLKYADLTGARLDDTVLTGADLRGACLAEVEGDPLSLAQAKLDKSAIKRSGYRMREVAQLVIRGADVNEKESLPSRPPRPAPAVEKTAAAAEAPAPPAPAAAAPPSAPAPNILGAGPRRQSGPIDPARSWLASIGPLLGSLRPQASRKTAGPKAGRSPARQPQPVSAQPVSAQPVSVEPHSVEPDSLDAPPFAHPVGTSIGLEGIDLASDDLRLPRIGVPSIGGFEPAPPNRGHTPGRAKEESSATAPTGDEAGNEADYDISSDDSEQYLASARQSLNNSILPALRLREASSRKQRADLDDELPASLRAFRAMDALITEARPSLVPTRPRGPAAALAEPEALKAFRLPLVGEEYLGVVIRDELPGGTTSRAFRGVTADGEPAVLKIFDPKCPGADIQLAAFQRGLRALSRVQGLSDKPHLRVAEMLCASTDQLAYVVRDYENGSIMNIVDVAITMKGGLEMFQTICESFAALHDEGVLVRAIKPSNILIDGLTPLIGELDMVDLPGLSEILHDAGGYASYVAPEERLGKGTRSPTADIYALGKLLEYLLTGHEPIAPVGSKPLIADRKGTPPVLIQLVTRCLAPDPADRYQYVSELLADLATFQHKGNKATLQASIRPGALSRLKSGPSIAPSAKRRTKAGEKKAPAPMVAAPLVLPERWLSRRSERILGLMGVGLGLLGCIIFYLAPSGVDAMESAEYLLAVVTGFAAWLLPRPRGRIVLQRIGLWAAGASLVLLLDPVRISMLRWRSDLSGGDVRSRENAVVRLTRLGHRDFAGRDLSGVSLSHVDLGNTNFRGANLEGTNLSQCFLVEANFSGARMTNAQLLGANLTSAVLDGAVDLKTVTCNRQTRLPDNAYCYRGHLRLRAKPKTAR